MSRCICGGRIFTFFSLAWVDCTIVLCTQGKLAFEFRGKSLLFLLSPRRQAVVIDVQHCLCQLRGLECHQACAAIGLLPKQPFSLTQESLTIQNVCWSFGGPKQSSQHPHRATDNTCPSSCRDLAIIYLCIYLPSLSIIYLHIYSHTHVCTHTYIICVHINSTLHWPLWTTRNRCTYIHRQM